MERENATKQRIRRVALMLFREKAFEDVTLNEICEKSGINKNTFYYHFRSKDDLLDQYYNIPCDLKTRQMSTILAADSFVEQFWLINEPMIDFVETSGIAIVKQIFIKNMTEDKGVFSLSDDRRDLLRLQKSIVEKGQAAGEFRSSADSKFLVMQFIQQIISTAIIWSVHMGRFDYSNYLRYSYENIFDVEPSLRKMKNWTVSDWVFLDD